MTCQKYPFYKITLKLEVEKVWWVTLVKQDCFLLKELSIILKKNNTDIVLTKLQELSDMKMTGAPPLRSSQLDSPTGWWWWGSSMVPSFSKFLISNRNFVNNMSLRRQTGLFFFPGIPDCTCGRWCYQTIVIAAYSIVGIHGQPFDCFLQSCVDKYSSPAGEHKQL